MLKINNTKENIRTCFYFHYINMHSNQENGNKVDLSSINDESYIILKYIKEEVQIFFNNEMIFKVTKNDPIKLTEDRKTTLEDIIYFLKTTNKIYLKDLKC